MNSIEYSILFFLLATGAMNYARKRYPTVPTWGQVWAWYKRRSFPVKAVIFGGLFGAVFGPAIDAASVPTKESVARQRADWQGITARCYASAEREDNPIDRITAMRRCKRQDDDAMESIARDEAKIKPTKQEEKIRDLAEKTQELAKASETDLNKRWMFGALAAADQRKGWVMSEKDVPALNACMKLRDDTVRANLQAHGVPDGDTNVDPAIVDEVYDRAARATNECMVNAGKPPLYACTHESASACLPRGGGSVPRQEQQNTVVSSCDAQIAERTKRFTLSEEGKAYISVMCYHGKLDMGMESFLKSRKTVSREEGKGVQKRKRGPAVADNASESGAVEHPAAQRVPPKPSVSEEQIAEKCKEYATAVLHDDVAAIEAKYGLNGVRSATTLWAQKDNGELGSNPEEVIYWVCRANSTPDHAKSLQYRLNATVATR